MLVVSDTGPLLHMSEAGALDMIRLLGDVHITSAVERELTSLEKAWQRPYWLRVDTLLQPYADEAESWQQAGLLHAGESEAIALARELRADWLLTDDSAARLLANTLGIEVHGSLGIILWVAASGHVDQSVAENTLNKLARSSLWISARVLAEARDALKTLMQAQE